MTPALTKPTVIAIGVTSDRVPHARHHVHGPTDTVTEANVVVLDCRVCFFNLIFCHAGYPRPVDLLGDARGRRLLLLRLSPERLLAHPSRAARSSPP